MAAPMPSYMLPGGGKVSQVPTLSPNQIQGTDVSLQYALNKLQNPTAGFEPIANLARTKLNTETIPGIAERFTAMGNNRNSSTFQNQLGAAATDLEAQLAALQSQYGLQNENSALNFLNAGLTRGYENIFEKREPNFIESLLGPLAAGATAYGGALGASKLLGGTAPAASALGGAAATSAAASTAPSIFASAATAAAPFALPIAGGAAALALPFLLYKFLNRD